MPCLIFGLSPKLLPARQACLLRPAAWTANLLGLQHAITPYQKQTEHFVGEAFCEEKCKLDLGFPVTCSRPGHVCSLDLAMNSMDCMD